MLCEMAKKPSLDGAEQTKNHSACMAAISRSMACFRSAACSSVLTRIRKDVGVLFSYPMSEIKVFATAGFRLAYIRKFCQENDKKGK